MTDEPILNRPLPLHDLHVIRADLIQCRRFTVIHIGRATSRIRIADARSYCIRNTSANWFPAEATHKVINEHGWSRNVTEFYLAFENPHDAMLYRLTNGGTAVAADVLYRPLIK